LRPPGKPDKFGCGPPRQKNREKETVNSAQRLVDDLKTRVTVPQ
jgi:hypothetical protein